MGQILFIFVENIVPALTADIGIISRLLSLENIMTKGENMHKILYVKHKGENRHSIYDICASHITLSP